MKADFFILCWAIFLLCLPAYLSAQSTKTHTIQKGETLFSIAKKYNTDIQQLKEWNDITPDQLSVGASIIVSKGANQTDTSGSEETQTHTVEAGETLFSISKQYQVTIAELKAWNDLSSNNLRVGETLTIYPSESADQQEQSITADSKTQQNSYYVVRNNDSLFKIAQDHGMSVAQLKQLNNLSSNIIRVGQKLTVRSASAPPSVAASSGTSAPQGKFITHKINGGATTVSALVQKFQMDEVEFRALNTDIQSEQLRNGQEVTVLTPSGKAFKNPYVKNSTSMSSLGSVSVSHYGTNDRATPTTSGDLYNPDALTGAHSSIALGSIIFVKNPDYPHGVFVRINDRISGDGLKLSAAAWDVLQLSGTSASATIYQN